MLQWNKLGQIFNPIQMDTPSWMREYGQLPIPIELNDDTLRIYFATRTQKDANSQYISNTAYIDVCKKNQKEIKTISSQPIFQLGEPGTFDEFGCMPNCLVQIEEEKRLYYTGWTRKQSVPYATSIGVASSVDGGESFKKCGTGPIIGISFLEPFFMSGAEVKKINGIWNMWYSTGLKWLYDSNNKIYEPIYQIVHATSADGIYWERNGLPIIPPLSENECQNCFTLFKSKDLWHAIFCYRKGMDFRKNHENSYRLGYAYSADLKNWVRDDNKANIDVSNTGWDSQMICYPKIGKINKRIYLYYCGNEFGREGFGYAELIGSE